MTSNLTSGLQCLAKTSVFLLVFLFNAPIVVAKQDYRNKKPGNVKPTGIELIGFVSCNGFGSTHTLVTGLNFANKLEITAGPEYSFSHKRLTGVYFQSRITFLQAEKSNSSRTHLYGLLSFERHLSQQLSQKRVLIEEWTGRNGIGKEFDFSQLRYKGNQVSTGFGVGHNFSHHLSLNANIAFSFASVKRINHEQIPTFYENQMIGLFLSTGVKYEF